jgi:hypothetical protein
MTDLCDIFLTSTIARHDHTHESGATKLLQSHIIILLIHNLKIECAKPFLTEPLTLEKVEQFRSDYYSNPKNVLAQNVCTRIDPMEAAVSRTRTDAALHVYNIKVICTLYSEL